MYPNLFPDENETRNSPSDVQHSDPAPTIPVSPTHEHAQC